MMTVVLGHRQVKLCTS